MQMDFFENVLGGYSWIGSETGFTTPHDVEKAYDNLDGAGHELFKKVCAGMPTVEDFVRENAIGYGWDERLLGLARTMHAKKLPRPVPYFNPPWTCFENSFKHAQKTGLLYVEGVAVNPSGVMVQAWNSTDGTDVLDFTWPHQHVNKYFGIVFDVQWMLHHSPIPGGILGYLQQETLKGHVDGLTKATIERFLADHVSAPAS